MRVEENIAAIATPPGEGGVGMIRLSGPDVITIASGNIKCDLETVDPRQATVTEFGLQEETEYLDHGIVLFFPEPKSYTGENVLELTCHGSPLLLQKLLDDLIAFDGARLAEPGEFTRRAFENDKLDLAQADAVASLISARSEAALKSSARQLQGELSEAVQELRENLIYCRSRIEACLDFSDQDSVGNIPYDELAERIEDIKKSLDELLAEGKRGILINQGCKTVIAGRPNVGKSSLLNQLLKNNRAIVTSKPGTTRDVISDEIEIKGIPFELNDTAGIRSSPDEIESEGVERSKSKLEESDLVLFVIDQSEELTENDRIVYSLIESQPHLLVVNKKDLEAVLSKDEIEDFFGRSPDCWVSAKTGNGLSQLREHMVDIISEGEVSIEAPIVTQTRHMDAFRRTQNALNRAQSGLQSKKDPTLVAQDFQEAATAAGEVTGDITTDDLLDEIFSTFCIGK